MSTSRTLYDKYNSVKEFVNRKSFKNSLVGILAVVLFFGVFNAYAQEDVKISPAWEGTKKFHNKISGTKEDEDNMNSRQGLEFLNTGWTIFSLMVPEATANVKDVTMDNTIPYDLRRGVLGMTEDVATSVYASYPMVDVTGHLAQQWVPGYNQSVSGLYAANYPSGYRELMDSGISSLWNRVLNISYLGFVIVMIASGFMIMFRHKLGGQTMVTLSSVLPSVIIALIVATFSFAIAGLVIDVGGILVALVAFVLGGSQEFTMLSTSNVVSLMFGAFSNVTNDFGKLSPVRTGIESIDRALDLASIVTALIVAPVVAFPSIILGIIVAAIVFIGAIKVLIVLFKSYFGILFGVIVAPLQIALGALPGNSHMMGNWFKSLLRNVLVFPVVLFIVNIPNAIVAASGGDLMLRLPGKLVYEDQTFWESMLPNLGLNLGGGFVMIVFRIFVLYFAAQAPKFLEAWLPPNSSKEVAEGMANVKGSLSKIPLVGGFFK